MAACLSDAKEPVNVPDIKKHNIAKIDESVAAMNAEGQLRTLILGCCHYLRATKSACEVAKLMSEDTKDVLDFKAEHVVKIDQNLKELSAYAKYCKNSLTEANAELFRDGLAKEVAAENPAGEWMANMVNDLKLEINLDLQMKELKTWNEDSMKIVEKVLKDGCDSAVDELTQACPEKSTLESPLLLVTKGLQDVVLKDKPRVTITAAANKVARVCAAVLAFSVISLLAPFLVIVHDHYYFNLKNKCAYTSI